MPRSRARTHIRHGHGAGRSGRHVRSARMDDLVQETIALRGDDLEILRPRDSEALLDERAFAEEDEFLPYWAELWPSGVALARALDGRALRGVPVVELGCGLGLPSIVAARAGGASWPPTGRRRR